MTVPAKTVPATVAVAMIFAFWVLTIALNAPGHLSYDSIVQLYEARSQNLFSMHPPAMAMLMAFCDTLLPGTTLFMISMSGGLFVSLMVTTRAGGDGRVAGIYLPLAVLFLASPLVLIYQGIIWKDVLFANLFVLTFALTVVARRSATQQRLLAWLAVAAAVAGVSALIRQQGVLSPAMLALTVAAMPAPSFRSRCLRAALSLSVAAATMVATGHVISAWANNPPPDTTAVGLQVLQRFDIVGMVAQGARLPDTLPLQDRAAIADYAHLFYTPARIDPIDGPGLPDALLAQSFPVGGTWQDMLRAYPAAYARHRLAHMSWVLWPREIGQCVPVHLGVSGDASQMEALGLSAIERPGLYAYARLWFDTPLYRHAVWAIAGLVLCAMLVRRNFRTQGDEVVLGALIGAELFAGSYLLIGIACDFRYLYTLPVTVIFAVLWFAAGCGRPAAMAPETWRGSASRSAQRVP